MNVYHLCVGMEGVFAAPVEHVLVLATPVRVFLVGATLTGPATGLCGHGQELRLAPDALYVAPSDNVAFRSHSGT